MYRFGITLMLVVSLVWLSACAVNNPYNSMYPPGSDQRHFVELAGGRYYPPGNNHLENINVIFEDGKAFNTRELPYQAAIMYFGANNPEYDNPQIDNLINLLQGYSQAKTTLWVFNAQSNGQTAERFNNCTIIWQKDPASLENRLGVETTPEVIFIDSAHKEIRWRLSGQQANFADNLSEALYERYHQCLAARIVGKFLTTTGAIIGVVVVAGIYTLMAIQENSKN